MSLRVYKKFDDDFQEELLGEYLNILSITHTNAGNIVSDAMVYYIQDDGSIGTANRIDVLIKDDRTPYYPNKALDEDDISEEIDYLEEEDDL